MADIRVDTIIAGGKIVTSSEVFDAAIAISDEKIVAIGPDHLLPPADRYIDASGKFVLPGLIDCHVHLDRCDSYELGSIAAAHSGLTTLLPFGTYDVEAEETLPSAINRHREEIESTAVVDFAFHYILNNRPYILKSLPQALEMGVTSFKMFMSYKKNQIRMCTDDFICQVMETVSKAGGIVQLHCESGNIIDYLENQLISQGCVHPTDFPSACPDWAEEEAINRAIKMGNVTNCPVYVVHLSTDVGMERIKQAQGQGQRVWTETCPQYLLLSDEEMAKVGPLAKIGPPLRPKDGPDQPAMWKGLELGYISTIGSDHAPHFKALKQPGWKNIFVNPDGSPVPFGSPGIETLAPPRLQRRRRRSRPSHHLAGPLHVGKPRPHLRSLPPEGFPPGRHRRRHHHHRPPGRNRRTRRRPPRQLRLHPLRRLEGQRQALDDPSPGPSPPKPGPPRAKTRLRTLPRQRQPHAPPRRPRPLTPD